MSVKQLRRPSAVATPSTDTLQSAARVCPTRCRTHSGTICALPRYPVQRKPNGQAGAKAGDRRQLAQPDVTSEPRVCRVQHIPRCAERGAKWSTTCCPGRRPPRNGAFAPEPHSRRIDRRLLGFGIMYCAPLPRAGARLSPASPWSDQPSLSSDMLSDESAEHTGSPGNYSDAVRAHRDVMPLAKTFSVSAALSRPQSELDDPETVEEIVAKPRLRYAEVELVSTTASDEYRRLARKGTSDVPCREILSSSGALPRRRFRLRLVDGVIPWGNPHATGAARHSRTSAPVASSAPPRYQSVNQPKTGTRSFTCITAMFDDRACGRGGEQLTRELTIDLRCTGHAPHPALSSRCPRTRLWASLRTSRR